MAPRFPFLVFRNLKTKLLGFGTESSIFPQISFHCCYNKKELRLWVPTWRWHTELFWVVAVLWLLFFSHSKSTMTDDADLRLLVHSLSMHSHQHCCIFRTPHSKDFFFSLSITIQTKVWKTAVCLSYWCLIIIHCCLVWGVRMIACSQTTMEDEPWSAISQQATCSWEVLCYTQRWNQGYSCQCFHTSNSAAQGCGEECTQHHHSHWAMWPTFENQDLQLENFQERIMFLAAMHNHKITKANTLKITVYCLRAA